MKLSRKIVFWNTQVAPTRGQISCLLVGTTWIRHLSPQRKEFMPQRESNIPPVSRITLSQRRKIMSLRDLFGKNREDEQKDSPLMGGIFIDMSPKSAEPRQDDEYNVASQLAKLGVPKYTIDDHLIPLFRGIIRDLHAVRSVIRRNGGGSHVNIDVTSSVHDGEETLKVDVNFDEPIPPGLKTLIEMATMFGGRTPEEFFHGPFGPPSEYPDEHWHGHGHTHGTVYDEDYPYGDDSTTGARMEPGYSTEQTDTQTGDGTEEVYTGTEDDQSQGKVPDEKVEN